MTESRTGQFAEVREIADALLDGAATPPQVRRLEELLAADPEARRFYLQYMDLHARMASSRQEVPGEELILRRTRVEEMILRRGSGGGVPAAPHLLPAPPPPRSRRGAWWIAASIVAALGAAAFVGLRRDRPADDGRIVGTLLGGEGVRGGDPAGEIAAGSPLAPGEVRTTRENARIVLRNGTRLELGTPAGVRLDRDRVVALGQGSLTMDSLGLDAGSRQVMTAPGLTITAGRARWEIDVRPEGETVVRVREGEVRVEPDRWKPRHYWSFDERTDRALDRAGTAHGVPAPATRRAPGLIGSGALEFDNTPRSGVSLGSGGGGALATGSFAVTTGITLEALIVPRWSGRGATTGDPPDYDEIFRKEGDGALRMVLSFQNDHGLNWFAMPEVPAGPVLAFGLYLVGSDYQELEILLDGQDGRPRLDELTDGRPHHVAATYDSRSGRKAIYIDGRLRQSHAYPPGTRILSGGPGDAAIGNTTASPEGGEPFTGVIDEAAFYDFALTAEEVRLHDEHVRAGRNVFGAAPDPEAPLDAWRRRIDLRAGRSLRFDGETGLPLDREGQ